MSLRRFINRFLLSLALGVITTITVAWSLVLRPGVSLDAKWGPLAIPSYASPDKWTLAEMWTLVGGGLEVYIRRATSSDRVIRSGGTTPLMRSKALEGPVLDAVRPWARPLLFPWRYDLPWPDAVRSLHAIVGSGWPATALWSQYASSNAHPGELCPHGYGIPVTGRVVRLGPMPLPLTTALPLGIVWRGFAFNAACYGAMWLAALGLLVAIRRSIRRGRGLCALCGYDLSGLARGAPCPECGKGAKP